MTDVDKQPARIAGMFDAIAGRYDTLNHLLSAGLDRGWRRRAVRALALSGRERVLDACTGTGDLAIEAVAGGAREVIGVDFAGEMLRLGHDKIGARALASRIHLARGDAMRLPFRDETFDAAMVAFGIRNVLDPVRACGELRRVLRPGGRLAVLEFGMPSTPGVRQIYGWYFRAVLPRIGRLVSRHGEAYSYLPASVARFPSGAAMADLLRQAGFPDVTHRPLTGGVVSLYIATNASGREASPQTPRK
ncbi:MAG TPA: bifunctional demethylmenaquinone methyltransferase/2-methoxy-6-polyprenyl-1,4-benzoquinol methylase UbiE [Vicinamibacterales bacterium]|nr:bifunctional demethylmenaquinone methyltransferase/2-methoxy-6-polyprenyl-1,4-benzoquinol methylase UbiE [Vicinamibacterales bacterium]